MAARLRIIAYHFPPCAASGSHRLLGFCRHLPQWGWQADVVAPPSMPWEPVDDELALAIPESTSMRHVRYAPGRLRTALRYAVTYETWIPKAYWAAANEQRRRPADALLTSGPPHAAHLVGWLLKRRFGLPWVVDLRDPWARLGRKWPGMRGRWESRWEPAVYRAADVIVANTPRGRDALGAAFPDYAHKVVAVTNGFDAEAFARPAPPRPGRAVRLVHAGDLYFGRDPRPLLSAIDRCTQRVGGNGCELTLALVGQTHGQEQAYAAAGGKRVRTEIVGQVSYRESLAQMASADILILLDSPERTMGVPAKLYEYIGSGRPILAIANPRGETAETLRRSGALHRVASPDDAEAIDQALAELLANRAAASARDGRQAEEFTRAATARQLAETLDRICGLDRRGHAPADRGFDAGAEVACHGAIAVPGAANE